MSKRYRELTKSNFLERTKKVNDCLEWTRHKNKQGYGTIVYKYKTWLAHRLSYVLFKGEIPKGLLICHKCDNPACVNIEHLFLGNQKSNIQDMIKKRRRTPYRSSHPFGKLTWKQVEEIRNTDTRSLLEVKNLATIYGVHWRSIYRIKARDTWVYS